MRSGGGKLQGEGAGPHPTNACPWTFVISLYFPRQPALWGVGTASRGYQEPKPRPGRDDLSTASEQAAWQTHPPSPPLRGRVSVNPTRKMAELLVSHVMTEVHPPKSVC